MSPSSVIAARSVDLEKPSGERVPFRVEFGPVYDAGRGSRCKVRFHGWGDSPPDISGYDSLEALILAVELVHAILAEFVRRGGRLLRPGTSSEYSLDDFVFVPNRAEVEPPTPISRHPAGRRVIRKPRKIRGRRP